MSPFKQILNFIMFVASVAYQQRLYKKMRERMEAEAEKRKGFLIPVRSQAVSLPVVYGKQKIAGVQTIHRVLNSVTSITSFNNIGFLDSGINDDDGTAKGILPIVNLRDGESSSEVVYDTYGVVDSSNTDQFHHVQRFSSSETGPGFTLSGGKNEFLFMQQAICQGGINKVKHIFVDENDYNSKDAKFNHDILVYRTGGSLANTQFADENNLPNTNNFTDCAYATMAFKLNRDEPNYNGIPDVQFLVEGRKIRDIHYTDYAGGEYWIGAAGTNSDYTNGTFPAESSHVYSYSNNPALILLDYLTNDKFGRGLNPNTEIDLESFYNAKQICARTEMVWDGNAPIAKSIPNAGFVNTVGQPTERTQSISLDISGAFTAGNAGSVTVLMTAPQINGNGLQGLPTDIGVVNSSNVLDFGSQRKSRISFGSGTSSDGVFKNALVKAVVTGTSDLAGTPLTSEPVIMPKNTNEESKEKNYAYTNEAFQTVTSITFTRIDGGSTDVSTENLCIGSSRNVNLPALYECNLTLDTADTIRNNIEKILNTMGLAELSWTTEGKYKLLLEYPQTATHLANLSRATFNRENVIRDEISISYNAATERFNQVTATFSNEYEDFKDDSITFPRTGSTVHNDFLTEDNNLPMSSDIDLTGITNPYHALAKAEQIVRFSRRINTLNITLDKSALKLEPGDFITIDLVDAADTNGYADIDNEIYRVESIAVQEDLSVKVQAYKFNESDLAWNVADNISYKNRTLHGFSVPPPSNLAFTNVNNSSAYNTELFSLQNAAVKPEFSSGRLTWTAASGVSKYIVEMARLEPAAYLTYENAQNSEFDWFNSLQWTTLGETRSPYFDLPSLEGMDRFRPAIYWESLRDFNSSLNFSPFVVNNTAQNLTNFVTQNTSSVGLFVQTSQSSPALPSTQIGNITSYYDSSGNYTGHTVPNEPVIFGNPSYITVNISDGSDLSPNPEKNTAHNGKPRFYVTGKDLKGNLVTNHPLRATEFGMNTGVANWKGGLTPNQVGTFPENNQLFWPGNTNSVDGHRFCTTILFSELHSMTVSGTVSGQENTQIAPANGTNTYNLMSSVSGGVTKGISIGHIEIVSDMTVTNPIPYIFSVRSMSNSNMSSSRVTTAGNNSTSPAEVNVDPMVEKVAIIYADDSSGTNQSYGSSGKTHRAIFNFTGILGNLPVTSYTLNGATFSPVFDVIAGQDGAQGDNAIVIYADTANQSNNNQSTAMGSNEFMAVISWDTSAYGAFSLPVREFGGPLNSYPALTFTKITGSNGVAGDSAGVIRVYYPELSISDPRNGASASANLSHFANARLNFTTMQLTGLPSDSHPTTGVSYTWIQNPPAIEPNNTQSFWFIELSFAGTGTSVAPVAATASERVIRFNNVVVFSSTNTSQTTLEELKIQLGGVGSTIIDGGLINTGSITANEIDANAITVNSLDVKKINGVSVGSQGINQDMFTSGAIGTIKRFFNFSTGLTALGPGSSSGGIVLNTPIVTFTRAVARNIVTQGQSAWVGGDGSSQNIYWNGYQWGVNKGTPNSITYSSFYQCFASITLNLGSFSVRSAGAIVNMTIENVSATYSGVMSHNLWARIYLNNNLLTSTNPFPSSGLGFAGVGGGNFGTFEANVSSASLTASPTLKLVVGAKVVSAGSTGSDSMTASFGPVTLNILNS